MEYPALLFYICFENCIADSVIIYESFAFKGLPRSVECPWVVVNYFITYSITLG